ncbi:MAG: hypothetical protein WCN21_05550 [Comamonadaceae bacterium]
MNLKTIKQLCLLGGLVISFNCSASVTLARYKNTSEVTITIDHQIIEEDLIEFKNALAKIETEKKVLHMNSVQLNSRGGSGAVGRKIGYFIKNKGLYTFVGPKSKCNSACVFILMGGVVRYAFGEIGVHRSTFTADDKVDDDKTEEYVRGDNKVTKAYAEMMDITNPLLDAMLNTESWRIRLITEKEKREWQVMGTDRVYEERLFTSIANELKIPRNDYIQIFSTNYEDCLEDAKKFERTAYECAKTKKVKINYWKVLKLLIN